MDTDASIPTGQFGWTERLDFHRSKAFVYTPETDRPAVEIMLGEERLQKLLLGICEARYPPQEDAGTAGVPQYHQSARKGWPMGLPYPVGVAAGFLFTISSLA